MTSPDGPPLSQIAAAIRSERDRAGLSLSELAKRAGLAKSTLSQLESGTGNPSIETLWALGVALGVPFSRLVDPPRPQLQVVRAGEGVPFYAEKADYLVHLLSSCPPGARRDLYVMRAEPGRPRQSDPHNPGTVEHVVMISGRALVGPPEEAVEAGPGDYVRYPGDVPHVFTALAPGTSAVELSEYH